MGFFRFILPALLALILAQSAAAQRAPSERICKNLSQCVDILSRHTPDEFDYAVLADEFRRFGPKGTDRVIGIMGRKDESIQRNAALLLHSACPQLTAVQADRLVRSWPRSVPVGSLIDMVGDVQSPSVTSLLRTALFSGDFQTIEKAYAALERRNPRIALKNLQDVVFALKDEQLDEALALSQLIDQLDEKHGGATFKTYAYGLAQDDRIAPMSNLVGLNAAIEMATSRQDLAVFSSSARAMAAFETLVKRFNGGHTDYWELLPDLSQSNPQPWIELGQKIINTNPELGLGPILQTAKQAGPGPLEWVLEQFLNPQTTPSSLYIAMVFADDLNAQKYDKKIGSISRNHPYSKIRILPELLRDQQVNLNPAGIVVADRNVRQKISQENRKHSKCQVELFDVTERVNEVPFFDWSKVKDREQYAHNRFVSTAWPRLDGWLIGFDKGEWSGGLLFISHNMDRQEWIIKDQSLVALVPYDSVPGKLYADRYWVITEQNAFFEDRSIFILNVSSSGIDLNFVSHVPESAEQFGRMPDNSLIVYYGTNPESHPPLRLSPDGVLTRACE